MAVKRGIFSSYCYGWFAIHKIDVTVPLRAEGSLVTPANVPFLFTFLSGFELPSRLVNIVFVLAVGLAVAIGGLGSIAFVLSSPELVAIVLEYAVRAICIASLQQEI